MNRLEVVDPDLPAADQVVWTGTLDEFTDANVDCQLSDEETDHLVTNGFVIVGGGAASVFCVRYATAIDCPHADARWDDLRLTDGWVDVLVCNECGGRLRDIDVQETA